MSQTCKMSFFAVIKKSLLSKDRFQLLRNFVTERILRILGCYFLLCKNVLKILAIFVILYF